MSLQTADYSTVFETLDVLDLKNDDYSYKLYREDIQEQVLIKSKQAIANEEYEIALNGLGFLNAETYSTFNKYQKSEIVYLIGYIYHLKNDSDRALSVLEPFENTEYPEIATLVAVIYRDTKHDMLKAVMWHDNAKEILNILYQNAGFDFVPEDAPEPHFEAYYQSAFTNYGMKQYQLAIEDLKGALFLRSSSRDALYMRAMCEKELDMDNACTSIRLAKKYGYPISDKEIIEFCK